jgi:hypothetical protein
VNGGICLAGAAGAVNGGVTGPTSETPLGLNFELSKSVHRTPPASVWDSGIL